jgi:3-methyladenine DNA glycosylase Mpg
LTSGPGRLTQAMGITYEDHKIDITKSRALKIVEDVYLEPKISRSHRIGVSADLKKELRFFINGNKFVSR